MPLLLALYDEEEDQLSVLLLRNTSINIKVGAHEDRRASTSSSNSFLLC
jgi:hypothetical protein